MLNQNINGVIPINKAAGMTSHDVVAKLRKILGTKKIGHTGTLDPEVTGVLPICIGKATRLSEFIMETPKKYHGQVTLGVATDTQDFTGEIIEKQEVDNLTESKVYDVFQSFIGEIEQIPPMHSAIKINGKKLYELAREGKEISRKPRKVTIYDLKITDLALNKEHPSIDFEVICSRGTYIRTLCFDIGKKLGYPAHMSGLQRTESGSFSLLQSYTIEEVEQYLRNNRITDIIISMANSLPSFKQIILTEQQDVFKVLNGQSITVDNMVEYNGIIKILDQEGNLIALYNKDVNLNEAKPKKVFK